jgi:biopolymer transport protein ExbB/TolQ
MQAARLASERAAAQVRRDMKKGLDGLATVASTAPWLGVFATIVGIVTAFVGCAGEAWACRAAVAARLSLAIWPTGLGMLVALTAFCFYRYLKAQTASLDLEMKNTSRCLLNQLSRSLTPTKT